jgi:uncharacterized protein DUF3192
MRPNANTLIILSAALLLSGCVIRVPGNNFDSDWNWGNWGRADWEDCQEDNNHALRSVQAGDYIDDVTAEFCEADFREVLRDDQDRVVEVLFFRTQHRRSDGETTHDETTPLVFVDDYLYGRGPIAYTEATGRDYPADWIDYRDWQDNWGFADRGWDDDDRDWSECEDDNRWALRHIEVGDTIDDVSRDFCRPDHREVIETDDRTVEVLYFRTQHRNSDGETTRDETTPLVFVEGELTGWGAAAYEDATGRSFDDW